jgi:selenocysteine-specific elongation factor
VFIDAHEQFALPLTLISQFLNVRTEDALTVARSAPTIRPINLDGDSLFTTDRKWNEFTGALLSSLGEFHAAHPLEPGRDMEELREKLPGGVTPRVFRAIVAQLEVEHVVEREGSRLRLPGHKVTLPGDGQRTAERITALLAVSPLSPPALADIQRETEIGRTELVQVLRVLEREGSIVRVSDDLYFLREAIHTVTTALQSTLSERDTITPAMFRDRFNTTRKYAIPLLEYLDREGVTTRIGDSRRLKARRTSA